MFERPSTLWRFNSLVERIQIGRTGQAYILNKKGEFQTQVRSKAISASLLSREFSDKELNTGEVLVARKHNDAGKEFIYVVTDLKNGDWIFGVPADNLGFPGGF